MVVLVIGKSTFCKYILNQKEIKILLEELNTQKLKEIMSNDEIFVDRTLSKMELEYAKLIVGNKITTEISIDNETLRLVNRLNTTKLLLITEKITTIQESGIEFHEPAYYLVTFT